MTNNTFFKNYLYIANICCNFIAENKLTNKEFGKMIEESEETVNSFFKRYNFTIEQISKIESITNKKIIHFT